MLTMGQQVGRGKQALIEYRNSVEETRSLLPRSPSPFAASTPSTSFICVLRSPLVRVSSSWNHPAKLLAAPFKHFASQHQQHSTTLLHHRPAPAAPYRLLAAPAVSRSHPARRLRHAQARLMVAHSA